MVLGRARSHRAESALGDVRSRADGVQREHASVGISVAVGRKFVEDRSADLASMIAFWAFASIFPLLLVLTTLLGYLLPSDLREDVLTEVSLMIPLIDTSTVPGLSGSWWALTLGLATALWSGTAVVRHTQEAFNTVWDIPATERSNLVERLVRSIGVLATIGLGLVISVMISGYVSATTTALDLHWIGRTSGHAITIVLDIGLFVAAFRWLTDREISTRDVLPGAVLSGIAFFLLQTVSALVISRYLQRAQATYGNFATVITILWWFYLQANITMLGAQLNVVLKQRLYPRAGARP